jgi:hypothetical protein
VTMRLWITIGLLIAVQLGALYVHSGYSPDAVAQSRIDLRDLPSEFENFKGELVKSDEQITRATGASTVEDRVYRTGAQPEVFVHCGSWNDPESRAPHLPQSCYAESGWQLAKSDPVTVGEIESTPVIAALSTWQRDGAQIRTLHWYVRGKSSFVDWKGGCDAYQALWGRTEWPPIEKVLMQTQNENEARARDRLVAMGRNVCKWMGEAK